MTAYFVVGILLAAAAIVTWRLGRGQGRGLQALIRTGALAMGAVSALPLLLFLFTGAMCGQYEFPAVRAQDGFWAAAVSEEDCGAIDSFHSSVQVWSRRHTFHNPFGSRVLASTIFTIGNDPRMIKLEWNGPHVLIVRYPNKYTTPGEFFCKSRWKDLQVECVSYTPDYSKPLGRMPNPRRWFY